MTGRYSDSINKPSTATHQLSHQLTIKYITQTLHLNNMTDHSCGVRGVQRYKIQSPSPSTYLPPTYLYLPTTIPTYLPTYSYLPT